MEMLMLGCLELQRGQVITRKNGKRKLEKTREVREFRNLSKYKCEAKQKTIIADSGIEESHKKRTFYRSNKKGIRNVIWYIRIGGKEEYMRIKQ